MYNYTIVKLLEKKKKKLQVYNKPSKSYRINS